MTDKQIRDRIVGALSVSMMPMEMEAECVAFLDRCVAATQKVTELEEDLRLAKEQLRSYGCDHCEYEALSADDYPCMECSNAGGQNSKWEWRKNEKTDEQ